jgi:hypothetical protein
VKKYHARHAILTASLSLLFVATSVMAQTTLVSVKSAGTNSGNGLGSVSRWHANCQSQAHQSERGIGHVRRADICCALYL